MTFRIKSPLALFAAVGFLSACSSVEQHHASETQVSPNAVTIASSAEFQTIELGNNGLSLVSNGSVKSRPVIVPTRYREVIQRTSVN